MRPRGLVGNLPRYDGNEGAAPLLVAETPLKLAFGAVMMLCGVVSGALPGIRGPIPVIYGKASIPSIASPWEGIRAPSLLAWPSNNWITMTTANAALLASKAETWEEALASQGDWMVEDVLRPEEL